jgi:hypothetical protein
MSAPAVEVVEAANHPVAVVVAVAATVVVVITNSISLKMLFISNSMDWQVKVGLSILSYSDIFSK